MGKGGFPGFGGNMGSLMKQAQKMQKDMESLQEELAKRMIESSSGGGAVTVVVNGKKEIQSITIKPEVVDPEEVETLQDLIVAALNAVFHKTDEMVNAEFGKISGGAGGLGGLF